VRQYVHGTVHVMYTVPIAVQGFPVVQFYTKCAVLILNCPVSSAHYVQL